MLYVLGVKGIFTAHGKNIKDISLNPILNSLYKSNVFELFLFIEENRNIIKYFCKNEKKGEFGNINMEYAM